MFVKLLAKFCTTTQLPLWCKEALNKTRKEINKLNSTASFTQLHRQAVIDKLVHLLGVAPTNLVWRDFSNVTRYDGQLSSGLVEQVFSGKKAQLNKKNGYILGASSSATRQGDYYLIAVTKIIDAAASELTKAEKQTLLDAYANVQGSGLLGLFLAEQLKTQAVVINPALNNPRR